MRKKALLALMMAAILLLSGCALIQKDAAVDAATEVLRLGDQVITKAEVLQQAESEAQYMYLRYALSGREIDPTSKEFIAATRERAVEDLKADMTLTAKAKELGLDQLTDEELADVNAKAQEKYDTDVANAKSSSIEITDDMDETAGTEAAKQYLADQGKTLDWYVGDQTRQAVDNKLHDYIVKDVTVTDEEIQADYDSKVASDKETYGENAGSWASAANNGSSLYYTPAGIRRVKQILTKFKDEDQTAINEAKTQAKDAQSNVNTAQAKIDSAQKTLDTENITDELKAEAEADLEAAKKELEEANAALEAANKAVEDATAKGFENIDEDTDAILASLDAEGADWQAIMADKNQDTGMDSHPNGYAVSADMSGFDAAFVEAAMALAKPGDHSGKVKGQYGYYIIRYDSDEVEGPAALADVKENISSALLKSKQDDTYYATVNQWVEEAGIKVDMNALKD